MKLYVLWFLWLSGVALESLLLARATASLWFRKYPFFFAYVVSVFTQDVFLLVIYLFKFKYYRSLYWYGEFISIAIGCGGDRDPSKRPKMAQVCEQLADISIVTSDNPRTENPADKYVLKMLP